MNKMLASALFYVLINCYFIAAQIGTKSVQQCDIYNQPLHYDNRSVVGGEPSLAKEFPHMTILGFGDENDIKWACGGSLISEQFVLTAAHCTSTSEFGNVKWARIGDLDIKDTEDEAAPQDFTVTEIIVHPSYAAPAKYSDIALLKLDRPALFTDFVKPACLYTEAELPQRQVVIATGWGLTSFGGEPSSHLMKVNLRPYGYDECLKYYKTVSKRVLPQGLQEDSQLCAGRRQKDTCQGDSGGPLQLKLKTPTGSDYYKIVGVTSFGKACGIGNSPGVYTKVFNYLNWIERNVWA